MDPGIAVTVAGGAACLFAYTIAERGVNQCACPWCGFRLSVDACEAACPGCGHRVKESQWRRLGWPAGAGLATTLQSATTAPSSDKQPASGGEIGENVRPRTSARHTRLGLDSTKTLHRMLRQWPRIALILVPSLIVTVDASVLLQRWREPDAEKAVRIVRASSSHIESFTIQQYLNSTIFHARDAAEDLGGAYGGVTRIEGWRASQFPGNHAPVRVRFSYSAGGVEHIAEWLVDVHTGVVKAASAAARDLSWND